MSVRSNSNRPLKRCWNCRLKKKACDRKLPACDRCTNRGETCAGYGTLLSWPREADHSRAVSVVPGTELPIRHRPLYFINVASQDVQLLGQMQATNGWSTTDRNLFAHTEHMLRLIDSTTVDSLALDRFSSLQGRDDMEVVVAAFSDGIDELYSVLIRLTANSTSLSTLALRYSLISLCFQRLGVPLKATQNQLHAIRALQAAIEQPLPWDDAEAFRALAASVVLYIYEMQNAESSLSWAIYFEGAKRIADTVYKEEGNAGCDPQLLLNWIFSHCTMYQFSVFHWIRKDYPQGWLVRQRRMVHIPVSTPLRQVILPFYGCSLELLDTLHDVFLNCLDRNDPAYMSQRHRDSLNQLSERLQSLTQQESVGEDPFEKGCSSHLRHIAEAYRLGALLYLERVARTSRRDAPHVAQLRSEAFSLLAAMRVCDRPWPLFVLSIEAENDDQRRLILLMMDHIITRETQTRAKYTAVRRMVREAWALQDLADGDDLDALGLYRTVIQSSLVPPAFI